ncbi:MAG TPA: hypothetical protein VN641_07965 [Urbifossiella sp.]|nr:hypothetical protein [Urbifossiella sp.]
MDQQLLDLYHRFVGRAFDRQLRFAEFQERKAPGADWTYDSETATLAFGKLKFEAPLVGSHAEHNDSWLWSWANRTVKLSITNRALGDTIRALAHRAMVPEFAKNAFPLEPVLGEHLAAEAVHVFGAVLVGELEYDAYFIAPYDDGRLLLMIRDDRLRSAEKHSLARVLSVFPQVMASLPLLDPRAALIEYAKSYGLAVAETADGVKIAGTGPGELTAIFDARNRLKSLMGTNVTMPKPTAPRKQAKAKPKAKKKAKPKVKAMKAKKR